MAPGVPVRKLDLPAAAHTHRLLRRRVMTGRTERGQIIHPRWLARRDANNGKELMVHTHGHGPVSNAPQNPGNGSRLALPHTLHAVWSHPGPLVVGSLRHNPLSANAL